MTSVYTRAFCRHCRLHFEYALAEADLTEDLTVLCPSCDGPAKHGPFQPCDQTRHELIDAQYEHLAHQVEARRATKRSKGRRREPDDEDEEYSFDRKRRKRSR